MKRPTRQIATPRGLRRFGNVFAKAKGMLEHASVTTRVEELTLVVVSHERAEGVSGEPYRGHPPDNDTCHVFAQDCTESPFLFDLRLRDNLDASPLSRAVARAVMVCTPELGDRETLRRLWLVASRVKRGGCVTLAYEPSNVGPRLALFEERLRRLAAVAAAALASGAIAVDVLPVSDLAEESAPLSAVWHRLHAQRRRLDAAGPGNTSGPRMSTKASTIRTSTITRSTFFRETAARNSTAPGSTAPSKDAPQSQYTAVRATRVTWPEVVTPTEDQAAFALPPSR